MWTIHCVIIYSLLINFAVCLPPFPSGQFFKNQAGIYNDLAQSPDHIQRNAAGRLEETPNGERSTINIGSYGNFYNYGPYIAHYTAGKDDEIKVKDIASRTQAPSAPENPKVIILIVPSGESILNLVSGGPLSTENRFIRYPGYNAGTVGGPGDRYQPPWQGAPPGTGGFGGGGYEPTSTGSRFGGYPGYGNQRPQWQGVPPGTGGFGSGGGPPSSGNRFSGYPGYNSSTGYVGSAGYGNQQPGPSVTGGSSGFGSGPGLPTTGNRFGGYPIYNSNTGYAGNYSYGYQPPGQGLPSGTSFFGSSGGIPERSGGGYGYGGGHTGGSDSLFPRGCLDSLCGGNFIAPSKTRS